MEDIKPISLDGEGYNVLKDAVLALLNEYPELNGRIITFSGLTEDGGISMEPESGALVYTERKDILGGVSQECQFPFFVVYRSNASGEYLALRINEFLDNLGGWISGEPVVINGSAYQLTQYPTLTGGRKIKSVSRFNSYALEPNQNNTQDWVLPITVNYTREFNM